MPQDIYDKIMMVAKRRGFIYPSFEIYGGIAGFYDYGPLGSQLKNNVENLWRTFFLLKDNCVEISTPTITLYEVLKASGHVEEFTDLTVDCSHCNRSYKVEDIIDKGTSIENAVKENKIICPTCKAHLQDARPVNLMFSTTIGVGEGRKAFLRPETAQGIFTNFHLLYQHRRKKLPFGVVQIGKGYRNEISPRQGTLRQREFCMAEAEVFFDPKDKTHPSFDTIKDNELILFDNEKEWNIAVAEAVKQNIINNQALAYYMYLTQEFLFTAGVDPAKFRFRKHAADELAHYATECWDAELYSERFGWVECVGIADRSAYDLNAHIISSGVDMYALRAFEEPRELLVKKVVPKMNILGPRFGGKAGKIKQHLEQMDVTEVKTITVTIDGESIDIPKEYYDIVEIKEKQTGEKFVPHVIEPSYGIDRVLYFLLEHNYVEGKKKEEDYTILKLNPLVAPIKVGVFPLISDDQLIALAKEIDGSLRNEGIATYYDESGTIGRRYARMDEIGTPFCITVDHDSLTDHMVTVRDRDTTKQERKNIQDIAGFMKKKMTC
ncbi:MAG: glycine--tRNA ligase [Thermoplasmata archaeon M11B2D]|nr:MAG: glycine--tRNA ligase [Thermoplasmata archaeon M11B2D]PNX54112.1 MAG: glycine--tRNA ligase [Thermoplasmata archaeon M9B2D]